MATIKDNNQENLQKLKVKMERESFLRKEFQEKEIALFEKYAEALKYKFSINDQKKTIKLYNEVTHRYGWIQKLSRKISGKNDKEVIYKQEYWYGFMSKVENNSIFNRKYTIDNNLQTFNALCKLSKEDYHKSKLFLDSAKSNDDALTATLKMFCGIVELDYVNK